MFGHLLWTNSATQGLRPAGLVARPWVHWIAKLITQREARRRDATADLDGKTTECNLQFGAHVRLSMHRGIASLLLFSVLGWCAGAFPSVECENLRNEKVTIPEASKGHSAVFVIGFTHASQTQTKVWAAKLEPETHPYSVAVLEDAPRLVRGMAIHGMKTGVAPELRGRFLVVFHGEQELKQAVGFDRPDDAYVVVVDRDGLIHWSFHGPFAETAFAELNRQLAELR